MNIEQYLKDVLSIQTFSNDDPELVVLREKRKEVENILRDAFPGVTIRYAGSYAKNTMIRVCHDLDLACYFDHEDKQAGDSLEEIRNSVDTALSKYFTVSPKTSALRLEEGSPSKQYTHVDVVPGRFINGDRGDVFLYQHGVEKCRLMTNLDTHIQTIRDSGLTDVIQLAKYWANISGIQVKTFVLELLVVKILGPHKSKSLSQKLKIFWEYLRDNLAELSVDDPANPEGNDLMPILDKAKEGLNFGATMTLQTIQAFGWEQVFGSRESEIPESVRLDAINSFARSRIDGTKPWSE